MMKYLEEWSFLERDHAHSMSGTTQALTATVLCLPVSNGAMADIHGIRNALSSAIDVMHTIGNSTRTQLPKLARTNVLVSHLSRVFIQEHILMAQCRDLLSTLASMHEIDPKVENDDLSNEGMEGFLSELANAIPGVDKAMSFAEMLKLVQTMDYHECNM